MAPRCHQLRGRHLSGVQGQLRDEAARHMTDQTIDGTSGGTAMTVNHPSSATAQDVGIDIHGQASPNAGRLLQFFIDTYSTTIPVAYFDDGTNFFTRTGITSSGTFTGASVTQPTSQPYMIGGWGDIDGPVFVSRWAALTTLNARHFDFMSTDAAGSIFELTIKKKGVLGWGVSTNVNQWDTFLGRGNAAATLQIGGPDTFTPTTQTLAAQNVATGATYQMPNTVASGQNQIVTAGNPFPDNVFVGQTVVDGNNANAIPANTTIIAISADRLTLTLSANVAQTIKPTETLTFTSVNRSANADLIVAAPQGTGTGQSGRIRFQVAPAGASGGNQNALQDVLVIGPSGISGLAMNAPVTFANLPPSPAEGMIVPVTDSQVNSWGVPITQGGGSNHVLAYYNGANWTVMAK